MQDNTLAPLGDLTNATTPTVPVPNQSLPSNDLGELFNPVSNTPTVVEAPVAVNQEVTVTAPTEVVTPVENVVNNLPELTPIVDTAVAPVSTDPVPASIASAETVVQDDMVVMTPSVVTEANSSLVEVPVVTEAVAAPEVVSPVVESVNIPVNAAPELPPLEDVVAKPSNIAEAAVVETKAQEVPIVIAEPVTAPAVAVNQAVSDSGILTFGEPVAQVVSQPVEGLVLNPQPEVVVAQDSTNLFNSVASEVSIPTQAYTAELGQAMPQQTFNTTLSRQVTTSHGGSSVSSVLRYIVWTIILLIGIASLTLGIYFAQLINIPFLDSIFKK
jgi:hypothetical protein